MRTPIIIGGVWLLCLAAVSVGAQAQPELSITNEPFLISGRQAFSYRIEDPQSRDFSLEVEYSPAPGGPFFPATEAPGGDGSTGLQSSSAGRNYVFVWDVLEDLGQLQLDEVILRITANGPQLSTANDSTPDFEVDTFALAPEVSGVLFDRRANVRLSSGFVEIYDAAGETLLGDAPINSADGRFSIPVGTFDPVTVVAISDTYETLSIGSVAPPTDLILRLEPDAPPAPELQSTLAGINEIQLRWRGAAEDELQGYRLYRAFGLNGFEPVGGEEAPLFRNTIAEDTTFGIIDVLQKGIILGPRYAVTAVDLQGNESALSNSVTVNAQRLIAKLGDDDVEPGKYARIPVGISNADGISGTGLSLSVALPPQAFTDAFVEAAGVTERVEFVTNIDNSFAAIDSGIISLQTQNDTPLAGEGNIATLFLQVAETVPDGTSISLAFEEVEVQDVDGNLIPVSISDTGTITVGGDCPTGDLNQDGSVDQTDLLIAINIARGRLTPSVCQQRALDLNVDGLLDGADVVAIRRLIEGLNIDPGRLNLLGTTKGDDEETCDALDDPERSVTLAIDMIEDIDPGTQARIPIDIDDACGVAAFDFTVNFVEQRANLTFNAVEAGDLTEDFVLDFEVNDGIAEVSGYGTEELGSGPGTVAILVFDVAPSAPPFEEFPVTFSSYELKGQFGDSFQWNVDTFVQAGGLVTSNAVPAPSLTVTVFEACDGAPVSGAEVTYSPQGSGPLVEQTSGLGVAVFPFAAVGSYSVTAALDGREAFNFGTLQGGVPGSIVMLLPAENPGECAVPSIEEILMAFQAADSSGDGGLSLAEAQAQFPGIEDATYHSADTDKDGVVTVSELFHQSIEPPIHIGDTDADFRMSLAEIIRMIQFYNISTGISCAPNAGDTEDGYLPNPTGGRVCTRHTADYAQTEWVVSLSELLRVIQIFSFGGYTSCEIGAGDDGFCLASK